VKRQAERSLVAAPGTSHPMDERRRILAFEPRPDFRVENSDKVGNVRKRCKQRLDKAKPAIAGVIHDLERGDVDSIDSHLAVADYAIARELKPGDLERRQAHFD